MGHLGTDPCVLSWTVLSVALEFRGGGGTTRVPISPNWLRATVRKSTCRNMSLMVTKQTIGKSSLPSSCPPFLPLLSLLPSFPSLFFLLLRCLLFRCSFCLISGVGSRCRGLNPQPVCAKHLSNQWASPTASRHQRNSESLPLQHHQWGQGSCPSYTLRWH